MPQTHYLDPDIRKGIRLFNSGDYFEAHEAFESAWRREKGSIRDLYRGILQVAVCYLHITRRNYVGAMKMYDRSQKWLAQWTGIIGGIHISQLRVDLDETMDVLRKFDQEGISMFNLDLLKPIIYEDVETPSKHHRHEKENTILCDRCGTIMVSGNCKITCPNCGNRFDCSDLTIYLS